MAKSKKCKPIACPFLSVDLVVLFTGFRCDPMVICVYKKHHSNSKNVSHTSFYVRRSENLGRIMKNAVCKIDLVKVVNGSK